jgi:hypothetical protein
VDSVVDSFCCDDQQAYWTKNDGEKRTLNFTGRIDLAISMTTVITPERHDDDLLEIWDGR